MSKKTTVECKSLGIPLREDTAREIDQLMKTLPKECTYRRKGTTPSNIELVKGEKADISMVSVETPDRDNEIVLVKGMNLQWFQENPVVTWCHKYDELPIGACQWIKKVQGGLRAKTLYSQAPEDCPSWQWFPQAVFHMTQEGILKGKSIGFLPTKIRAPTQDEITKDASWKNASAVIESARLVEYACCSIPVNQASLVETVAKAMDNGEITEAMLKRMGLPTPSPARRTDSIAKQFLKRVPELLLNPDEIIQMIRATYRA